MNDIGTQLAGRVGRNQFIREIQFNTFAVVGQRPGEISQAISGVQLRVSGAQGKSVSSDYTITSGQEKLPERNIEENPLAPPPAADVDALWQPIMQFDVFVIPVTGNRVKH